MGVISLFCSLNNAYQTKFTESLVWCIYARFYPVHTFSYQRVGLCYMVMGSVLMVDQYGEIVYVPGGFNYSRCCFGHCHLAKHNRCIVT